MITVCNYNVPHLCGYRKIVYRLVKCSSPRKSLVKGERFIRGVEEKPECLKTGMAKSPTFAHILHTYGEQTWIRLQKEGFKQRHAWQKGWQRVEQETFERVVIILKSLSQQLRPNQEKLRKNVRFGYVQKRSKSVWHAPPHLFQ